MYLSPLKLRGRAAKRSWHLPWTSSPTKTRRLRSTRSYIHKPNNPRYGIHLPHKNKPSEIISLRFQGITKPPCFLMLMGPPTDQSDGPIGKHTLHLDRSCQFKRFQKAPICFAFVRLPELHRSWRPLIFPNPTDPNHSSTECHLAHLGAPPCRLFVTPGHSLQPNAGPDLDADRGHNPGA